MNITENEWNELKSIVLEIKEGVKKLTDEAGKEMLTPAEVCKILKISRNTYQNYVNGGIFEQTRIGKNKNSRVLVKRSDIERLMGEGKI